MPPKKKAPKKIRLVYKSYGLPVTRARSSFMSISGVCPQVCQSIENTMELEQTLTDLTPLLTASFPSEASNPVSQNEVVVDKSQETSSRLDSRVEKQPQSAYTPIQLKASESEIFDLEQTQKPAKGKLTKCIHSLSTQDSDANRCPTQSKWWLPKIDTENKEQEAESSEIKSISSGGSTTSETEKQRKQRPQNQLSVKRTYLAMPRCPARCERSKDFENGIFNSRAFRSGHFYPERAKSLVQLNLWNGIDQLFHSLHRFVTWIAMKISGFL